MGNLGRKLKRQQQLQEVRNSYCRKCGTKLSIRKGEVFCRKCGTTYGKVRDRI